MKPLPAWQFKQLQTLTRCVRGELRNRTRYGITLTCNSCAVRDDARWTADALCWLIAHLRHRTFVSLWTDDNPMPEPDAVDVRHRGQRVAILAALNHGDGTLDSLARAADVSRPVVRQRVQELEATGKISRTHNGRGRGRVAVFRLTENGKE